MYAAFLEPLCKLMLPRAKIFNYIIQVYVCKMPKRPASNDHCTSSAPTNSPKLVKTDSGAGKYVYDEKILKTNEEVRKRDGYKEPIPKRDTEGRLLFSDAKDFRPNMTPKEVLQDGSFGGTYFRPIKSAVTGLRYNKMWNELPQDWLEGTYGAQFQFT